MYYSYPYLPYPAPQAPYPPAPLADSEPRSRLSAPLMGIGIALSSLGFLTTVGGMFGMVGGAFQALGTGNTSTAGESLGVFVAGVVGINIGIPLAVVGSLRVKERARPPVVDPNPMVLPEDFNHSDDAALRIDVRVSPQGASLVGTF